VLARYNSNGKMFTCSVLWQAPGSRCLLVQYGRSGVSTQERHGGGGSIFAKSAARKNDVDIGFSVPVGISMGVLCLGHYRARSLTVVLRVMAAMLWVAIKILEHRSASADREPRLIIEIEDDRPMRDITPLHKVIDGPGA